MVTHFSDGFEAGNFTTAWTDNTVSGSGVASVDSTPIPAYAGTYRADFAVPATAGWARCRKALGSALPEGTEYHLGMRFRVKNTVSIPSGNIVIAAFDNGSGPAQFSLALHANQDASGYYKALAQVSNAPAPNAFSVNGIVEAQWHKIDLYCGLKNVNGFIQLFVNDIKEAEVYGVDTHNFDTQRLTIGPSSKSNSASVGHFYYDEIVWDDEASPSAPGGSGTPWGHHIISPLHSVGGSAWGRQKG